MAVSLLIGAALTAASPLDDPWSRFEGYPNAILVQSRFSSIVCAGVCTNYDLLVASDGTVLLQTSMIYGRMKSFRYRIPPATVQEFWRNYSSVRPKGLKGPVGDCNGPMHVPIFDLDIRWQDDAGPSRLLACTGAIEVNKIVRHGFGILRISPFTGERLTAEQAEIFARP
jgi:hypothetical protein